MTFSQRMGIVKVRQVIQVESLDQETRNALWNLISPFLKASAYVDDVSVYKDIWTELYNEASDTVPRTGRDYNARDEECYYRFIRKKAIEGTWNECLDLVEFIVSSPSKSAWSKMAYDSMYRQYRYYVPTATDFNAVFEKYMVGYRFVDGLLARITEESEILAVEKASAEAGASVREQLSLALQFLADRKAPNYAKSIACSISAVEAQCRLMLGSDKPELGKALKQLEGKGVRIHPVLKVAFEKLYGFTSDDPGIRHGCMDPSDVDQALAKFMLVSCSAFVNYLNEKILEVKG